MTLYQIITAIMNASGKNAKRDVLRENADNELLKAFLKATYDPRIQYGMKKLPPVKAIGPHELTVAAIQNVIENLAERKVTGTAAKKWFTSFAEALTQESQALLNMMMARDIRAGIAENSVLEVWPGLFFVPPYQRCAGMDEKTKARFASMPFFYVQLKSDGQFCYAIHRVVAKDDEFPEAQAMTRAGSLYPEWLANEVTQGVPAGYVAMGELLIYRNDKLMSRKDGNGILNSVLSGDGSKFNSVTDEVAFVAWDMVTEEEFDAGKSDRRYAVRLAELEYTPLQIIEGEKVTSIQQASTIHNRFVARKEEGSVWKNPDMGWRDCSSGDKDMMKVKVVFEAEYEIIDAYEGEGKAAGMLGGFTLATSDRSIVFNCGSGFSDEQRKEFWRIVQDGGIDVFNGTIVAAEGNDIVTSKGKTTEAVFLPIFVEIRLDKTVADSRARVWAQFEAAKEGRKL